MAWVDEILRAWVPVPTEPLARDVLIGSVIGVAFVAATPIVVGAAGFTSAGVGAGTFASWLMSSTTAAGSLFATFQSIGAIGGLSTAASAATIASGAVINTVGGRVVRGGE